MISDRAELTWVAQSFQLIAGIPVVPKTPLSQDNMGSTLYQYTYH
jgi:hypothetical protein